MVSLYGARTKPSAEDLRGLDVLVVDLQDAGVRFYTYASTMLLCLEAAAEAGLEVVVLDRPNPLGGERVEGPERDPAMPFSLVSVAPGPLVHGLTLGEMARLVDGRRDKPGRVSVVAMSGWKRGMTWSDTGRPWVDPSPNLRSAEAALAYPGTCLLEATNATEGRGTEAPFLLVGRAVDEGGGGRAGGRHARLRAGADRLHARGVGGGTAAEAPRGSLPGPSRAGHGSRPPRGPWALGLRLLIALRRHPEFQWVREGAWLDTLSGTKAVRAALERGDARRDDPRRRGSRPSSAGAASGPRLCSTDAPPDAPPARSAGGSGPSPVPGPRAGPCLPHRKSPMKAPRKALG